MKEKKDRNGKGIGNNQLEAAKGNQLWDEGEFLDKSRGEKMGKSVKKLDI